MVALGLAWVALLVLLLTLSLAMGRKGGEAVRKGITEAMLQPLGEGARQALQRAPRAPQGAPQGPPTPLRVVPDPDPALWPPMGQLTDEPESWGTRAIRGLQAV